MIRIRVMHETGYEEAKVGLGLSYNQPTDNMHRVAMRLANRDGGENKFLESLAIWLDITAPRWWWQEFDTYRTGITKQSSSTVHTLTKRPLTQGDFNRPIPPETLHRLNQLIEAKDLEAAKNELPEGFLQRRIICTNYKTLRRMILQRHDHRMPEWAEFCRAILAQVQHPYFLPSLKEYETIPATEVKP